MESANHSKRGFPGCRPPCVLPVSPEENETHENGCVKSSLLVSPEFAGTSGFMSVWRKENRRRGPVQAGNRHWDMTVQQSWELEQGIWSLQPGRTQRSNGTETAPEMNARE